MLQALWQCGWGSTGMHALMAWLRVCVCMHVCVGVQPMVYLVGARPEAGSQELLQLQLDDSRLAPGTMGGPAPALPLLSTRLAPGAYVEMTRI